MNGLTTRPALTMGVILAASFSLPLASADDEGLRARLMAEAPGAWSKIARSADHLEMKLDQSIIGNVGSTSLWHVKFSGDNCLVKTTYARPDGLPGREQVFCRNARYSFQLDRTNPNGSWRVSRVGATPDENIENIFKLLFVDSFAKPQLCLGHVYLPKVFGERSFVIKNVESRRQGSNTLISFAFEYSPPEGEKPIRWVSGGVVSLNPALAWAIEDFRIDVKFADGKTQQQSTHNDLTSSADGLPLWKGRQGEIQTEGQPAAKYTSKVQSASTREIPEKEFTLTAFELPEDASPDPFR
jgi:hypothetical protein